jgi:pilus assembly protein CpaB
MAVLLFFALLAASVAGFSALQYASSQPAAARPAETRGTAQVVIAASDLPVGALVGEQHVQVVAWPENALPAGYISNPEDVIGRGIIDNMKQSEPFLISKVADQGSGAGLPIIIPEGMRAMSVRVDEVVGVAGFVVPGTRVDVLLSMKPENSSETYAQAILHNITVLASNQVQTTGDDREPLVATVMTLLVTPDQAEELFLASQQGRIQLALRNMLDVDSLVTPGARTAALFNMGRGIQRAGGGGGGGPAVAQQRPDNVIEIFRGGQRTTKIF